MSDEKNKKPVEEEKSNKFASLGDDCKNNSMIGKSLDEEIKDKELKTADTKDLRDIDLDKVDPKIYDLPDHMIASALAAAAKNQK